MNLFKNKYRIIKEYDNDIKENFYIVQIKFWFMPLWIEYGINGYIKYQNALELLNKIKDGKKKKTNKS